MRRINKPTLLVDKKICLRNIEKMATKCKQSEVNLRPHFKTHHSVELGNWFKDFGVQSITVSSFEMAQYFSDNWQDITVAVPVNLRAVHLINELTSKISLNVLVEDELVVEQLNNDLKRKVGVFVKIDTGYGRTGVHWSKQRKIRFVLQHIRASKNLLLKGLIAHPGHTYSAKSKSEILDIGNDCNMKLRELQHQLKSEFPELVLSVGDTPYCSISDSFEGIDEVRPGNFVFYDVMQEQIGSNASSDIAVCLAAPILAIHSDRKSIVIHGGGIHLSKDRIIDRFGNVKFWKGCKIKWRWMEQSIGWILR